GPLAISCQMRFWSASSRSGSNSLYRVKCLLLLVLSPLPTGEGLLTSQHGLDLAPARFGDAAGAPPGLLRLLARRGAVEKALHDALQDAREAKHVIGDVVIPMGDAVAAGAPAIGGDVGRLVGDAGGGEIGAGEAAEHRRLEPPVHHVIGEIGERVAERRELPVDD